MFGILAVWKSTQAWVGFVDGTWNLIKNCLSLLWLKVENMIFTFFVILVWNLNMIRKRVMMAMKNLQGNKALESAISFFITLANSLNNSKTYLYFTHFLCLWRMTKDLCGFHFLPICQTNFYKHKSIQSFCMSDTNFCLMISRDNCNPYFECLLFRFWA